MLPTPLRAGAPTSSPVSVCSARDFQTPHQIQTGYVTDRTLLYDSLALDSALTPLWIFILCVTVGCTLATIMQWMLLIW